MMIEVLKSKIHCARVTEANLNYMVYYEPKHSIFRKILHTDTKKEEQLASLLLLSSFPKLNQDYMGKDTESNN